MEDKWISVKERLPEYDVRVLVHEKVKEQFEHISVGIACLARTTKTKNFERHEFENAEYQTIEVTHWMPLPEPPKHP